MAFTHLKIGLRLTLGFGFLLLLSVLLTALAVYNMERLSDRTEKLYKHPFTVSTTMLRLDGNIVRLHDTVEDALMAAGDVEQEQHAAAQARIYEELIEQDFQLILDRFLGDKADIKHAQDVYQRWSALLDEEIEIIADHERQAKLQQIEKSSQQLQEQLTQQTQWLTQNIQEESHLFAQNIQSAASENQALDELLESFHQHAFAVSNAAVRIDAYLAKLYMVSNALNHTIALQDKEQQFALLKKYQSHIRQDFESILSEFVGDKTRLNTLYATYQEWQDLLNEKVILLRDTRQERKLAKLDAEQEHLLAKLSEETQAIIAFANNKATSFLQHSQELESESLALMIWLLLGAILCGMAFAYFTAQSIIKPLRKAVHLSEDLSQGRLTSRMQISNVHDETGRLLKAMNNMAEGFQQIIMETRAALAQLANGNTTLGMKSEFVGDFSEIKTALQTTAEKLGEATDENQRQTWVKTGQAQLNERLRGEQDVNSLAKNTIDFLVTYLKVEIGLLYLVKQDEETGDSYLQVKASYGYTGVDYKRQYHSGEGLVGQTMLERKTQLRTHAAEECLHIVQSELSQAVPKYVILLPFAYEQDIKGVIELGTSTKFNQLQRDFLEQAMPNIGIAVNTAESRTQMGELLTQSQLQTEQLQAQKAEMQHTNEELQSQQEELESQQEELRQTNEQLEARGREMERQQQAVETKNKELETAKQAMQVKAEELELASKYKSEFLANMSHELRTPLNSLLILAQLLSSNKEGNLSEKQIECATTIHSAGSDLLSLINEILDLSKVESGKVEISPEQLGINELVNALKQKFQHVAEEKSLYFNINLGDKLPVEIYTDPQRLKQVINNLLSNAFKFTEQGGISVDIRRLTAQDQCTREDFKPERSLAISVTDTGIGIAQDKQKVIFEAFQQADGTTSRRFGGTGLGLSISRQLAQLMGGEIQLHSTTGEGSCFTLYLPETCPAPQKQASMETLPPTQTPMPMPVTHAPTPTAPSTPASLPSLPAVTGDSHDDRADLKSGDKSLLIVEDDRVFSRLLMELAWEKSFKCLLAENGKDGLELAESYLPSAIILDVGLPQIDGWTVMEKLKSNPTTRHIPVHFVSGADQTQDARKMGAIGYSLKPVSMGDIGDAFREIERFISQEMKSLLIVTDNSDNQQEIVKIVSNDQVNILTADSKENAWQQLQKADLGCMILDVGLETHTGLELLKKMCQQEAYISIPVIIYAEQGISDEEQNILQECSLTIKSVRSPERLLDETTLFLHEVESHLPEAQQKMLRMAHDKEAILSGKKALIFDDDPRNMFALTSILENKGMDVIMAGDGEEGLELLESNPDTAIVLMDIMMPKMDGYEAMQNIRAQLKYRKLPIIALTAKAMKEDRGKCLKAGASDYLAKPVDTDKLLSLMRVWLYQ